MGRYRMDDGMILDTKNASQSWEEETDFDGRNFVSRATGSQWDHERLYRSRRGRYYLECWSQWQGSQPHAEYLDAREATRWLLLMEHELPDDLQHLAEEITDWALPTARRTCRPPCFLATLTARVRFSHRIGRLHAVAALPA